MKPQKHFVMVTSTPNAMLYLNATATRVVTSTFSVERIEFEGSGYPSGFNGTDPTEYGYYPDFPNCTMPESLCQQLWDQYKIDIQQSNPSDNFTDPRTAGCPRYRLIGRYCDVGTSNEEIVLLYWPPEVESRDICAERRDLPGLWITKTSPLTGVPRSIVTDAITFRGRDLYVLSEIRDEHGGTERLTSTWDTVKEPRTSFSVIYGNFTFVSPTVYIAHHTITAEVEFRASSLLYSDVNRTTHPGITLRSTQIAPAGTLAVNAHEILSSTTHQRVTA